MNKAIPVFTRLGIAAALASAAFAVQAQSYPDKPVRIVVPFPPGGNVDISARIIGGFLQAEWNQPFLVDNKPGASGLIGGEFAAKSKPDGYTLLVGSNSVLTLIPLFNPASPFDAVRDMAPISSLAITPMVVAMHPSVPVRSMQDLVALAKKQPGTVTMATPSGGSINHLAVELFMSATGTKFNLVHYKGNAPLIADLLGGQIQGGFDQLTSSLPHIKSGKFRALAVTSPRRAPDLPDVPTLEEAGFPGQRSVTYTGILAPRGTPADVVAKLNGGVNKALGQTGVKEKFAAVGAITQGATVDEFTKFLRDEQAMWGKVIRDANIKPDS
jgi:tripartite-type tricarboxylate transporter receptor subunit TctC